MAAAGPGGAGAAADRELLDTLGLAWTAWCTDRPARSARRPRAVPARRGPIAAALRRINPPLGLDAQAIWAASLRLALARREPRHQPDHLALALVTLDPAADWVLRRLGVDRRALAADLAAVFPPPSATGCCGPSAGSDGESGLGTWSGATSA